MEIPDENFAKLMSKALAVGDGIKEIISKELNVSGNKLDEWAQGKDIPDNKFEIVRSTISIMLKILGRINESSDI